MADTQLTRMTQTEDLNGTTHIDMTVQVSSGVSIEPLGSISKDGSCCPINLPALVRHMAELCDEVDAEITQRFGLEAQTKK